MDPRTSLPAGAGSGLHATAHRLVARDGATAVNRASPAGRQRPSPLPSTLPSPGSEHASRGITAGQSGSCRARTDALRIKRVRQTVQRRPARTQARSMRPPPSGGGRGGCRHGCRQATIRQPVLVPPDGLRFDLLSCAAQLLGGAAPAEQCLPTVTDSVRLEQRTWGEQKRPFMPQAAPAGHTGRLSRRGLTAGTDHGSRIGCRRHTCRSFTSRRSDQQKCRSCLGRRLG